MPYQNIDVSSPPPMRRPSDAALEKLPFPVDLMPQERKNTLQGPIEKTRTDSVSFARNARRLYLAKLPGYYSLRPRRMVKNS